MTAIYLEVIRIYKAEQKRGPAGDIESSYSYREVFATKKSVYMRERYEAMAHGFKPEIVFLLSDCLDYQDEQVISYNGKFYKLVRVDQSQEDKSLSLVCERLVNGTEVYAGAGT